MAYKDEYEVARLYTNGDWEKSIRKVFAGDLKVRFHLAPPMIAPKDPASGEARKISFGPWMLWAFKGLAKLKGLRKTGFDPFGQTEERKMERRLRDEYEARLKALADNLTPQSHDLAVKIAELPDQIRGFGHVKEAAVKTVEARRAELEEALAQARLAPAPAQAAE
jgi:indolepyruvate ferredoxin oxidoreductase